MPVSWWASYIGLCVDLKYRKRMILTQNAFVKKDGGLNSDYTVANLK